MYVHVCIFLCVCMYMYACMNVCMYMYACKYAYVDVCKSRSDLVRSNGLEYYNMLKWDLRVGSKLEATND